MNETVYFYNIEEPFGCFSNFSRHSFDLEGQHWPTSEHYFQAQKFAHSPEHFDKIRTSRTPREAFEHAQNRAFPRRADWERVKDDVMRRALMAKFGQNKAIREILLSTGDKMLVEKTTEDYYWGCGTNMNGLNKLGNLLMELREAFRRKFGEKKIGFLIKLF